MNRQRRARLESKVKDIQQLLNSLNRDKDLVELLKIFRRPGWTTPAEYALVLASVDSLMSQLRNLNDLKSGLLKGSRLVSVESMRGAR